MEVVEGFIVFKEDTVTIKGVTDLHWEAPLDYNVLVEITFNQKEYPLS
jgi:RNA 3'-terminal phosphate cyclase